VSAPKPDDASEPASDADGWALLEGLRRRLDDQAAHSRKTQAQVSLLAESIGALVAQQRRRSLWLNVNSFVAYVVFTILCGAGCFLLYRSRAHELSEVRDRAIAERDAAVRHSDEGTVRAVAREAADTKAWEVYQLLDAGKRGEAVAKLDALRDQPLSRTERAVLAARVHDTQVMEVDTALKAAVASFKAGRPGDAIKPLEAALTVEASGPRAATIHYYLGVAYAKTDLASSIAQLQAAIAGDVDQDDARFQLASVLDRSGAFAPARAEYDRFATAHPQSPLAVFAMRRSATLARLPAAMPPAANGAPGAVARPAVGQPAAPAGPAAGQPVAPAATPGRPGLIPVPRPGVVAPGPGAPAAGAPAPAPAAAPAWKPAARPPAPPAAKPPAGEAEPATTPAPAEPATDVSPAGHP
jgi:tetratricopeptide (TPR) repeat protein